MIKGSSVTNLVLYFSKGANSRLFIMFSEVDLTYPQLALSIV